MFAGLAPGLGADKMQEAASADSRVIHSLPAPSSPGVYSLPYNPIVYPPYGYPGYPDTTGLVFRTPYDVREVQDALRTLDGDVSVSTSAHKIK